MNTTDNTILKQARIPSSIWSSTLKDEGSPKHLAEVVNGFNSGDDRYYDGVIFYPNKKNGSLYTTQAFLTVAKEIALTGIDLVYITPLHLIAILEEEKFRYESEVCIVENLFMDALFVEGAECPYTTREIAMLKDFLQFRYFEELGTSILSLGSWKKASTWYASDFLGLFVNYTEVEI